MANPIYVYKLEAQGSSGSASSYTTNPLSPLPNRLILVAVRNKKTGATPTLPVLSGTQCGLTWTQVDTVVYDTVTQERITLFRAFGSGAIAGTLQFTFGGTTQNGCQWAVLECQLSDDTGGSNGSNALVQFVQGTNPGSTQASATLAAFGSSNNATIGIWAKSGNGAWTPGTGFTQLSEQSFATGRMITEWRIDNDTSVDTSTFTSSAWGGWGIEVKAAADPAFPTQLLTPGLASLLGTPSGSAIYVSYLNGVDATGDGSSGNPYKTLDKALTVANSSDIIRLKYDGGSAHQPLSGERTSVQVQGKSQVEPLMIETDPADNPDYKTRTNLAFFRGELQIGDTAVRAYSNLIIQNLHIEKLSSLDTSGVGGNALRIGHFRNLEVRKCYITNTNASAVAPTCGNGRCENLLIHHCLIDTPGSFGATHNSNYNHDHCIYWGGQNTLGDVFGGAVWNNILSNAIYGKCFQYYADTGSSGWTSSTLTVVAYNTMYHPGNSNASAVNGWHVAFGGVAGQPGPVNNLLSSNLMVNNLDAFSTREAVLFDTVASGNQINNNLVYQIKNATKFDAAGSPTHWTLSNNILEQDPQFTDPASLNFRIPSSSPAVGQGQAAFLPPDDFYGTPRGGPDIGAVEAPGFGTWPMLTTATTIMRGRR